MHVFIERMHLVDNHHFAGQSRQPDEKVLDIQHPFERLIYRPDPEWFQQCPLGWCKPLASGSKFLSAGSLQPGRSMNQPGVAPRHGNFA
ncbi:hypothetical protein SDC9_177667 [bioreactor metagenome]|uniref:Uncharacterized protein n=1 Tax=bioreactor metagenome TaxID=1076179 RepID=A0A645H1J2_9ZZZZ